MCKIHLPYVQQHVLHAAEHFNLLKNFHTLPMVLLELN